MEHPQWSEAMTKEIQVLEENQTWDFAALPFGKKALRYRWV